MKKILLTFTMALVSAAASAQDLKGTTIYDRIGHGQDSIDVLGSLSLYQESFKSQEYLEALEPWEFVFQKAPLSMIRVYTDGAWMFETLIQKETDAAKKKEYFDKLMKIYDQRLANLDALNSFATPKTTSTKGNIICRKAYDYYYFCPSMDSETAYKMFKEGINDMGPNTEAFVLYAFMDCSYRRYMANKTNIDIRQEFIQDYMLTNDICDRLLEQAKEYPSETIPADPESEDSTKWVEQIKLHPEAEKIITAYQPTQTQANDLFVSSGAADCEALERIYSAQVEANKTNLEYLNAVLAILNKFECDKSNIYYTAADYAYQINKTPQAAIGKASRLLKEDDVEGAIKYFDEAIELETDEAKKAKYSYIVAALMFKQGKISQCRQYCRKSLQFNPSNGDAYLLQASCIARMATGDHLQKSYYYCLATDYCNRAKAVDPATAAKANRQAATYASYYYPKSEAFFAGIKAGQKVNVAGETTTLRLR
ncbi:MAG: hypothetical protein Q4F47_06630 [Bacteroidaceae bacterium]|nr:hypothetical protein [Bacteroidaceae bacterium]MDO5482695.1 hypothetical protein [Bacteroidaceae bacterium]